LRKITTAPVIAGLAVGIAFIVLFSYSFAFEQVPALPSKSPALILVYEGREYVGVPGSYGWSNGRPVMNADVSVDLEPQQVIELKNSSTISFVTKDDYITRQPDVFQVLAAETGQNFTYSGFDPAITLEQVIDHRDPDPSNNNVFLVNLDDGHYVLMVHAGWSPEQNKLTGGVSYFFKIRMASNTTILEPTAAGPLIVLTDNKLLSLNGNKIVYEKELERGYSEVSWDGDNFYLATLQKPGSYEEGDSVENELLVLDQNFNEVSSHHIGAPVYDFAAQDGIVYFLTDTKLKLLDLSQEDPSFVKTNRSVSFEKHVHDIIVKEDHAYLLDNIAAPLYIHRVDLRSLEVRTREFTGVNAHLVAQDVSEGKWYVVVSSSVMTGYFEGLSVFGAEGGQLYEDPKGYRLLSLSRDSTQEPKLEEAYQISRILVNGQIVYALGYGFSLDAGGAELKLGIYSLDGEGRQLALIGLNDTSSEDRPIATNIILLDKTLYVGGEKGIYVLDVSDPESPFARDIIETETTVRFFALV
jgi:hypothetical protein